MPLKFAAVFERTTNNYSAYVPDLPGCISTGSSLNKVRGMIREAVTLYIETTLADGEPIVMPRVSVAEAEAYHRQSLTDIENTPSEFDGAVPALSVTFEMVQVEVEVVVEPAEVVA